jgi:hypothetical protein
LGWVEGAGEVGGDEGEEPVEEPVGGGGLRVVSICYAIDSDAGSTYHRETLSTSLQREQFAGNHPGGGAEAGCEERYVYAQEDKLCKGRAVVLGCVGGYTGDRHDELTRTHTERTDKQNWATTESVNAVQSRKRRENVDQVDDDLKDEGVGKLLDIFCKVRCAIINLDRVR